MGRSFLRAWGTKVLLVSTPPLPPVDLRRRRGGRSAAWFGLRLVEDNDDEEELLPMENLRTTRRRFGGGMVDASACCFWEGAGPRRVLVEAEPERRRGRLWLRGRLVVVCSCACLGWRVAGRVNRCSVEPLATGGAAVPAAVGVRRRRGEDSFCSWWWW